MKTKLIHRFLDRQFSTIAKPLVITFILLFSATTTRSYAQQEMSSKLSLLSNIQNKAIVRSYHSYEFVSYVETASQHLFLWVNENMNIISAAEIPTDLYVKDFEIQKEIAYFCGYREIGGLKYGMIGYFRIDESCHPATKDIYVFNNIDFFYNGYYIDSREFTELEVFDKSQTGDSVFLVAVGKDPLDHCLVLEAIGEYNNQYNWRFALGRNCSDDDEKIEQISVTDKYVVTAGIIFSDRKNGMGFRVFDKMGTHDMFSNPTIHDNVYRYFPQSNPAVPSQILQYPINSVFEMTAMDNNEVATLSLYRQDNGGMPYTMYYGFLLNVYDITQTITVPNSTCVYSMGTPESYYYGSVQDLRYDGKHNRMVAALTADVPAWGPQSVCAMIPYTLPLPITVDYNYPVLGEIFNKVVLLDLIVPPYYSYLTSSYCNGYSSVTYYRYPSDNPLYTPHCTTQGQETCDDPGVMKSKYDIEPLNIHRKISFDFNTYTMTCVEEIMNHTCDHEF